MEAFKLAEKKEIRVEQKGTASCVGEIDGYKIWLGFKRGIPAYECSCGKNIPTQVNHPCFHAIAVSILWDRKRDVPDPSLEDIAYLTQKH
jgi:hypothetical protein